MIPKLIISDKYFQKNPYVEKTVIDLQIHPSQIIALGNDDQAIKIETIRELKKQIALKPLIGKYLLVLISNAENLNQSSQNALLKTLEEPPEHAIIFLFCTNENQLLPTIVSRCEIIRMFQKHKLEKTSEFETISLQELIKLDIGEKFALAEKISAKENKEDTLEIVRIQVDKHLKNWLKEYVTLAKESTHLHPKIGKLLYGARIQINQNLNIRLILENLFLSL